METQIPEGFKAMIRETEGIDAEALLAALDTPPSVSVKINRRKLGAISAAGTSALEEVLGYRGLEPVEWCSNGYYLPERPQFTLNPLMHAGAFYVQDASSMIYETLVSRYAADMAPGLALDMCAAPGGKSTSILNALPDGWKLVSNEFMPARAQVLKENLIKWGYPEITVTSGDTAGLTAGGELFGIVAVDAPCSGEGMMRKESVARTQWSPGLVRQCATLQRSILDNACEVLLPGGLLIYSTCTFNRTENEENVDWLVREHGLELLEEPMRFMPHLTRGEGLFVAVLRKPGVLMTPRKADKMLERALKGVRVLADGIPESLEPLRTDFDLNKYPVAEVELETALQYLRHQAITLALDAPRGLMGIAYKGIPLGMAKNLGNRANNMYPKEWRIRNL